jgi:uncharacterized protein (DUF4415 family)
MSANKKDIAATWHDPDDAPELDDAWFQEADVYQGERLVRRGRPRAQKRKVSTTIRFDADIVDAFRSEGEGWQTRINDALREWLDDHPQR